MRKADGPRAQHLELPRDISEPRGRGEKVFLKNRKDAQQSKQCSAQRCPKMLSDPNFKYSELHPNGPFPMFKEPEYFLPLQASVSYFFFLIFLAMPRGMQNLSSRTRDGTQGPCSGSADS